MRSKTQDCSLFHSPHPPSLHSVLSLPQKYNIIHEIKLLQEVAKLYNLEPKEQLVLCFQFREPLDEER